MREDTLDGETVFAVIQRSTDHFYRFSQGQWQLALLFDGIRSYEEISLEFTALTGARIDPEDVRLFAAMMEESDFWYKTPQEKNLAYCEKIRTQRERRAGRKSKFNLTHMFFSGWDPDRYLTWLDKTIGRFVYSPWCVLAMVLLFVFEATVFASQWNVIGPDAKLYYNFTQKSLLDLIQFWVLFLALGFLHESAHGLTCKHFGGEVHAMGLMFMYLLPAFFVDTTEMWISASKLQRLATIIAGIWIEMVVCGFAMILWSNTAIGSWVHDFAYQVILITGIAVILINLNPLMKLDGYYLLTNIVNAPDLKETSTEFLSAWFQSRILRLNVETPVVPRKRVPFFILYALISGAYSYMILFFVIRFSYNVAANWLAEFAIIPAGALALSIFRGRLRSLRNVAVRVWEEKLNSGRRLRPLHYIAAVLLAVLLVIPLWRDRETAYFVIEPTRSYALHATIPGRVNEVLVHEGEHVRAGQPLLTLDSPLADSMTQSAAAQSAAANFQAFNAELQGESVGAAAEQQNASQRSAYMAKELQSSMVIAAPEDGIVLTSNPTALLGQQVASGQLLLDLASDGPRAVRIYIPGTSLERLPAEATVALELPGLFSTIHLTLAQPGGDPVNLPQGLVPAQNYKGVKLPVFYSARMMLPSSAGDPHFGVGGSAKVFGVKRSLAGHIFLIVSNIAKAHIW
ncbi:MAG: biotin/lipoyl-binding protein [Acidobacteriaceae bacterium]|nr:biotin/lipoyl-binding protein [Acidobacteriaceae bacterium]